MLGRLKDLFASSSPDRAREELRLAAAALLAEAARLDGRVSPAERAAMRRVLSRRFGLNEAEAAELAREGEAAAADSTQIFEFTRVINRDWPVDQRADLFEMIYEVIYADDALHDLESSLMRKLGELIYLPDRERNEARQRVLHRLRGEEPTATR
jgi:uncharacterized tellurite resistance protein B-like protein